MDLKIEETPEQITVRVSGEITAEACGELRKSLLEQAAKNPDVICLDMGGVPFIDSSGLGVLIGVRSHMRKYETRLEIQNLQPSVIKVFQLTRLSKVFGLPD